MGTNYYATKITNVCQHCGRGDSEPPIHIGKSSIGWCFGLHVTEELPDLEAWKTYLCQPGIIIKNEYGDSVSFSDLINTITKRRGSREKPLGGYDPPEYFHAINHSQDGPNGLLRHKIEGHCVGHGAGTWDLVAGEFF